MPTDDSKLRQFIGDLVRLGAEELVRSLTIPISEAEATMRRVADAVCLEYARSYIYVPAGYDPRNREIVAKFGQSSRTAAAFTRARIHELAAEYAVSWRQIYSILREARLADFRDRQGTLPLSDPAS